MKRQHRHRATLGAALLVALGLACTPRSNARVDREPLELSDSVVLFEIDAQVVAVEIADTNGAATFTRPNGIPAGAAGWIVQVFDFTTCTSTQAITL